MNESPATAPASAPASVSVQAPTLLVTVFGADRPGVTAGLFGTLEPYGVEVVDIEQGGLRGRPGRAADRARRGRGPGAGGRGGPAGGTVAPGKAPGGDGRRLDADRGRGDRGAGGPRRVSGSGRRDHGRRHARRAGLRRIAAGPGRAARRTRRLGTGGGAALGAADAGRADP